MLVLRSIIITALVWSVQAWSLSGTRAQFLQHVLGAAATATIALPAYAKEVDPAIKGTKKDPNYEKCLSVCMYDCTKPKGSEQKSRQECLPECKQKCAKTKAQLMLGTPKE
ncbi:hypothetical protein FisN_2Lh442 [Fistulifera solaris]|uniref:Uncharacterized protein n=1 Tax=Fistulifera solaris TaxID=1519565 RepID=A0A1Z5JPE7_FISSO|nr:hypothetical protein FisN_2Lh442 [Fistulifera solaris]|eukprot:GAX15839.1 hypothetical protein FisN_2Lh442 [Fistulifera solaris]